MRVLSYNIHKGIGGRDRRYRLQRIIDVIASESPDFVCLQEVDRNVRRSKFDDQPALLREALGLEHLLYQLNFRVQTGGYGNLLLSRWPIVEQHQVSLGLRQRKPRAAQWGHIETPFGQLRVVNWHLGLIEHERHWQVRRLLEYHTFRNRPHLPTIIIGDTNDWRNTLAAGPFAVHGYQHVTAPPSRHRTFPAYFPMGALDKAFIQGRLTVERCHAVRTRLARDASDHLPLVVDFQLLPALPRTSLPMGFPDSALR